MLCLQHMMLSTPILLHDPKTIMLAGPYDIYVPVCTEFLYMDFCIVSGTNIGAHTTFMHIPAFTEFVQWVSICLHRVCIQSLYVQFVCWLVLMFTYAPACTELV